LPYRRAGLERLRSRCDEIFARTFTLTIDPIPDRDVGAHECVSRPYGHGGWVTGFQQAAVASRLHGPAVSKHRPPPAMKRRLGRHH
jgi:hypothetical protein